MSVLLFLVPVSLALAGLFVAVCLLSIRAGQFDDLESPRWRLLFENAVPDRDSPVKSIPSEPQP